MAVNPSGDDAAATPGPEGIQIAPPLAGVFDGGAGIANVASILERVS